MSTLLNKLPASRKYRLALYFVAGLAVVSLARMLSNTTDLTSTGTIAAAAGLAVPIGLAGLGGIWSERAGVANIGLEGMMILGTFGAGWMGYQHGPWAGVLAAVILGGFGGLLFAIASVSFGVDQIIAGTAINILGLGITQFLARILFDGVEGGGQTQSPPVPELPTVSISAIAEPLSAIQQKGWFVVSDLAGLVSGFFFRMSVLTVLTIALFVFTTWLLWRTPFGLRTRSAGENPHAAESLGVNVYFYKYVAVTMSGLLAGLGGAYLAIVGTNVYREGQTAGRGFIGLATMIFGNWRPGGTAMGAGIFGYIDALQLRDDANVRGIVLLGGILLVALAGYAIYKRRARLSFGLGLLGAGLLSTYLLTKELPAEVAMVAPYIVTLLVLATASQRLRPPAADGIAYRKGESH